MKKWMSQYKVQIFGSGPKRHAPPPPTWLDLKWTSVQASIKPLWALGTGAKQIGAPSGNPMPSGLAHCTNKIAEGQPICYWYRQDAARRRSRITSADGAFMFARFPDIFFTAHSQVSLRLSC
eukprot:5549114-Amphidinium_carterae.2